MILKNNDIVSLLGKVKSEAMNLVCFGAGRALCDACDLFSEFDFFDNIYQIIDNNPKTFIWRGHEKEVVSPDVFFENVSPDKIVVYITPVFHYPEMFEQLNNRRELSSVECYIHEYVLHRPYPYNIDDLRQSDVPLIPKKIHYCWFGGKEIPSHLQAYMSTWQKYCPDYEIIRWDERNYDVSKHPYIHAAYKEKKYGFVADYAKLDIIYQHGGIHLDTDVELFSSLDRLLYNKGFCGVFYCPIGPNFGLGFGAVSCLSLLAELRNYYDSVSFYNDDGTLNLRDCCFHNTQVLKRHGYLNKNITQLIDGMMVYPTDVLSPMDVWLRPLAYTKNTVSAHHFDGSWFDPDDLDRRKREIYKFNLFLTNHPVTSEQI